MIDTPPCQPRAEALGRLALVVDDNALNSHLAMHMLTRLGWRACSAANGEAALSQLASQRFDLVLLDLRMPGVNGEEVCQRIREQLDDRHLPIVAYTAFDMPGERERLLKTGFTDLLAKPISFEDMRRVCTRFTAEAACAVPVPVPVR